MVWFMPYGAYCVVEYAERCGVQPTSVASYYMESKEWSPQIDFREALERWNARGDERGYLFYNGMGFDPETESAPYTKERERKKLEARMFTILKMEAVSDAAWDDDDVLEEMRIQHEMERRDHHDYVQHRRGGPMYWWAPWLQCMGCATVGTVVLTVFLFLVFGAILALSASLKSVQEISNG